MTTRPTLPQNFNLVAPTVIDSNFKTASSWNGAGSGTKEEDTTNFVTGAKSLKLSVTSAGASYAVSKAVDLNLDDMYDFEIGIFQDPVTPMLTIMLIIATDTSYADYYWAAVPYGNLHSGYQRLIIPRSIFGVVGSPSWKAIKRLKITVTASAGTTGSVSIDDVRKNSRNAAKILITMDDNYPSQIDAVAYCNARNIPVTLYTVPDFVSEDGGRMTLAELQAIYAAGNTAGNHSKSHDDFSTLTAAEIETTLGYTRDWLIANSMPRGAYHVAYPWGYHDADVQTAMTNLGMLTGRIVTGSVSDVMWMPHYNMHRIICYPALDSTISLATAKAVVDRCILYQGISVFLGHIFAESAGSSTWATSDFHALIDYIVSKGPLVQCVTIDELYNGIANPRYRSLPVTRAVV